MEDRLDHENLGNNGTSPISLTLDKYLALKGADNSLISRHCETIYEQLTSHERKIAEVMFRRMVSVGDSGNGLRRPTLFSSVAEISDANFGLVEGVVARFAAEGASFVYFRQIPEKQDASIDITHESLIRQWRRLGEWQRAERRSYETYKDLNRAVEKRRDFGGGLWSGNELAHAVAWRQEEKPTARWARRYDGDFTAAMGFLSESENREHAARREREDQVKRVQEEKIEIERIRAQRAEAEAEAVAARAEARIANLHMSIGIGLAIVIVGIGTLLYLLRNASTAARELVSSLSRMDAIALDLGPEYRRRLLVLRASLIRSVTVSSFNPVGFIQRRALFPQHGSTLETMKTILLRAPMFGGEFDAVGTESERKRVIALLGDDIEEYDLEKQTELRLAKSTDHSIKGAPASSSGTLARGPPAVDSSPRAPPPFPPLCGRASFPIGSASRKNREISLTFCRSMYWAR